MYNPKEIQAAFTSLVGVRQSTTPGIPQISSTLAKSLTGKYADSKQPLATTENLYYSSPNFDPTIYPLWSSGSDYVATVSIVNSLGIIYQAKSNITNDVLPPAADSTNWVLYSPFSLWLQQKYDQASDNLISEVVKSKKLLHMGKAILERQELYRGHASIYSKIISQNRFVGFQIFPQSAEALWVYFNQIGIQLTAPQNLRFYLYNSSVQAPLNSWLVNIAAANTFSWSDLNISSPFVSWSNFSIGQIIFIGTIYYVALNNLTAYAGTPATDPTNWSVTDEPPYNCILKYLKQDTSSSYYFGYYESDITGNALSKSWDCTTAPCEGCDGLDLTYYNQWSKYTTFRNIQVPASGLDSGRLLFDTSKVTDGALTNWGMNFRISVRCDLTDFIIENKYQFADAFQMQLCKEFLEAIANGIRIGPNPAQTKLSAIATLDPKAPGNWVSSYCDSIQALNLDMSGFSQACMPCTRKGKAQFFSM